jgi:hypothetical protein
MPQTRTQLISLTNGNYAQTRFHPARQISRDWHEEPPVVDFPDRRQESLKFAHRGRRSHVCDDVV